MEEWSNGPEFPEAANGTRAIQQIDSIVFRVWQNFGDLPDRSRPQDSAGFLI